MVNLEVREPYLVFRLKPWEKLLAFRWTNPRVLTKHVKHVGETARMWSEVLEPDDKTPQSRPVYIGVGETRGDEYLTYVVSARWFLKKGGRVALAVRGDSPGVFVDIREEAAWQLFAITTPRARYLAEELRAKIGPRTR